MIGYRFDSENCFIYIFKPFEIPFKVIVQRIMNNLEEYRRKRLM